MITGYANRHLGSSLLVVQTKPNNQRFPVKSSTQKPKDWSHCNTTQVYGLLSGCFVKLLIGDAGTDLDYAKAYHS